MTRLGEELLNVPMGDMIRSMAEAVADAQRQLDEGSVGTAEWMGGYVLPHGVDLDAAPANGSADEGAPQLVDTRIFFGYDYKQGADGVEHRTPRKLSLMELGFTPSFYQFVDTVIEVRIAVSIRRQRSTARDVSRHRTVTRGGGEVPSDRHVVATTAVDATYSNHYSFQSEGASLLRTQLVPVPPPTALIDRIRQVAGEEAAYQERQRSAAAVGVGT